MTERDRDRLVSLELKWHRCADEHGANAATAMMARDLAAAEVRAEQLEAALQEATEKLAREMWVAAELADGEIYDIDDLRNEWDTDGLLPATYDKWLAVARAAVAGDPHEPRP